MTKIRTLKAVLPLLLALLYGASPLDLIPDVIPLIGWLDDSVVLVLMVGITLWQLKHRRALRAQPAPYIAPPRR